MAKINPKHDQYAQARALGVPGREAAISVGYAAAGAAVQASRLDSRADIKKAIAKYKRNGKSDTPAAESDDEVPRKSYLKPRYDSPLALFEDLMNNKGAPDSVRVEAAKLALPYRHGKITDVGKKEKERQGARDGARGGKFPTKTGPGHVGHRMN
ncbi:terminase small subunit [Stenotrophomonas phage Silvanus]|nr:terminase small subunit [Stenotrophomonas phage Silvanus]